MTTLAPNGRPWGAPGVIPDSEWVWVLEGYGGVRLHQRASVDRPEYATARMAPAGVTGVLYWAVRYLLDRRQEDPDLGYYIGFGTEAFRRLCVAEAVHLGEDLAAVEQRRLQDRQPPHRRREADVVRWRPVVDAAIETHGCNLCGGCYACNALREATRAYVGEGDEP